MTGATHFIEVWKSGITDEIYYDDICPIHELSLDLKLTELVAGTTIAIWKIKFKTKDNA